MLLDFKEKKIAMDIHAKNARNTDKEENQTALRFCTAYSMLKGNGTKKAAQPLVEEIRQFLLGNAMLTRTPKSQVLTSTIVNFLLIAHLGHGSSGLAMAFSICILFILSISFILVSRLKRQPLLRPFIFMEKEQKNW